MPLPHCEPWYIKVECVEVLVQCVIEAVGEVVLLEEVSWLVVEVLVVAAVVVVAHKLPITAYPTYLLATCRGYVCLILTAEH